MNETFKTATNLYLQACTLAKKCNAITVVLKKITCDTVIIRPKTF